MGKLVLPVPAPSHMHNKGKNYVGSLSEITAFLGGKAEEMGVEVYSGIAVSNLLYSEDGKSVVGVATKDMGISKSGKPKDNFERGMAFNARQVVLAEGCHGSLTKEAIKKFDLRKNCQNQSYGLGIKEVWEVSPEKFKKGFIAHTMGYPYPTMSTVVVSNIILVRILSPLVWLWVWITRIHIFLHTRSSRK